MEVSLKGLILAASTIIVCILLGIYFFLYRNSETFSKKLTDTQNTIITSFDESRYDKYIKDEITGTDLLVAITEFAAECNITIHVNQLNAAGNPDKGSIVINGNNYDLTQLTTPIDGEAWINPSAKFIGTCEKSTDGVVHSFTFEQTSAYVAAELVRTTINDEFANKAYNLLEDYKNFNIQATSISNSYSTWKGYSGKLKDYLTIAYDNYSKLLTYNDTTTGMEKRTLMDYVIGKTDTNPSKNTANGGITSDIKLNRVFSKEGAFIGKSETTNADTIINGQQILAGRLDDELEIKKLKAGTQLNVNLLGTTLFLKGNSTNTLGLYNDYLGNPVTVKYGGIRNNKYNNLLTTIYSSTQDSTNLSSAGTSTSSTTSGKLTQASAATYFADLSNKIAITKSNSTDTTGDLEKGNDASAALSEMDSIFRIDNATQVYYSIGDLTLEKNDATAYYYLHKSGDSLELSGNVQLLEAAINKIVFFLGTETEQVDVSDAKDKNESSYDSEDSLHSTGYLYSGGYIQDSYGLTHLPEINAKISSQVRTICNILLNGDPESDAYDNDMTAITKGCQQSKSYLDCVKSAIYGNDSANFNLGDITVSATKTDKNIIGTTLTGILNYNNKFFDTSQTSADGYYGQRLIGEINPDFIKKCKIDITIVDQMIKTLNCDTTGAGLNDKQIEEIIKYSKNISTSDFVGYKEVKNIVTAVEGEEGSAEFRGYNSTYGSINASYASLCNQLGFLYGKEATSNSYGNKLYRDLEDIEQYVKDGV